MSELTTHANRLLGWARVQGEKGLRVAGIHDQRAVQELVEASLVREEREESATGYSGRIYSLPVGQVASSETLDELADNEDDPVEYHRLRAAAEEERQRGR